LPDQTGDLLIELADLLLEELQLLQRQLQQPPIDGVELCACAQCIAQLFGRGSQLRIGLDGQSRRVGFIISERLQAETPLGSGAAPGRASTDTFSACSFATDAVRDQEQTQAQLSQTGGYGDILPESDPLRNGFEHLKIAIFRQVKCQNDDLCHLSCGTRVATFLAQANRCRIRQLRCMSPAGRWPQEC
jgi:hypothetical protein